MIKKDFYNEWDVVRDKFGTYSLDDEQSIYYMTGLYDLSKKQFEAVCRELVECPVKPEVSEIVKCIQRHSTKK